MGKKWTLFLVSVAFLTGAASVEAAGEKLTYQNNISVYRQAQANFARDKQLYNAAPTDANFETLMDSARDTFAARQTTILSYLEYLSALVHAYVTDSTQVATFDRLFTTYKVNFSDITDRPLDASDWSRADSTFASTYARFNETAYQAFAWIYWSETSEIVENYITLYQNQNQRIINGASNDVERREKTTKLQEIENTLASLREKLADYKKRLPDINSQTSYESLRADLNKFVTQTEESLKVYVKLE